MSEAVIHVIVKSKSRTIFHGLLATLVDHRNDGHFLLRIRVVVVLLNFEIVSFGLNISAFL